MSKIYWGYAYVSITSLLWGFLPVFLKKSLEHMDVFTLVAARFIGAAVVLGMIVFWWKKQRIKLFPTPPILWLAAIALCLNYILTTFGVQWAGPATEGLLIQVGPLVFVIGGVFIFKERLILLQKIGFIFASMGFLLYYYTQISQENIGELTQNNFILGALLTVLGGVAWGIFALAQKKLVEKYPPQQLNVFMYAVSGFVLSFFVDYDVVASWDITGYFFTIFLVLNTLLAYGFLSEAMKLIPANQISMIISVNPVVTFFFLFALSQWSPGWVEERAFTPLAYVAVFIVLVGVTIVVGAKKIKQGSTKMKLEKAT